MTAEAKLDADGLALAALRLWTAQAATGLAIVEGPRHRIAFANDSFGRILGSPPERLVGRCMADAAAMVLPARDARALLDQVLSSGCAARARGAPAIPPADGDAEAWDFRLLPLRGRPDGPVEGVLIEATPAAREGPAAADAGGGRHPPPVSPSPPPPQEREAMLRLAVEAGGLGFWEVDLATGAIAWDEATRAMHGIAPGVAVDVALVDSLIHPDDLPALQGALAAAADPAGEGLFTTEARIRRPSDGAWRVLAGRGRTLFDERAGARRAARVIGVIADVTARRAAEAALRDSEARLRFALEAGGLGTWSYDLPTGEVTWDARTRRIFGVGPAETIGYERVVWHLVHPDDRARVHAAAQAALDPRGRGEYAIEHRITHPDGTVRWASVRGRTMFEGEGAGRRALRMTGTALDVTERVTAEAGLAATQEKLRLALEAAELGVCDWNLRTGEMALSERCRRLYACRPDVAADYDGLMAVLHPDDRATTDAAITRALEAREDFDLEHRVLLPGGGTRWLRVRGGAETGPDGAVTGLLGVVVDVTPQKQAEAALREDKERLEARVAERTRALTLAAAELQVEMRRREEAQAALLQAQKLEALGQLTGGVAHDFNNVLAAVMGSLRLIGKRVPGDAGVQDLVRNGERAAERAAGLVRQLLAFARREDLVPTALDPAAVLAGSAELLRRTLGTGVAVHVAAADGVWAVQADRHRLELALLNLAFNARDAMGSGGLLTVEARNAPAGADAARPPGLRGSADFVVLSVRDTGPGMTPEVLARAAEPFFTTKPRGRGTGLGLAMVHGFARQSGGAMRILSAPGEGTTVEIWLPRAAALPAGAPPEPEAEPDPAHHGNATVLVVDDDEPVRVVTAAQLRDLGYQVIEAGGAEAGLVMALAAERLDLLVTDVVMPGGDGPSLAARLRAERPGVPVLFLTGFTDDRGMLAGEAVLGKPFTPRALAEQVAAALGRRAWPG